MAWQYWTEAHRQGRWREVSTPHAGADPGTESGVAAGQMMRVRTTSSAVSKGTETLVHTGRVPPRVAELMSATNQMGDFPNPVSYGYLAVGVVDEGPA
ncbi:MAG: hypothetical protein L0G54_14530, partial [Brevibacterium sp.]|nr:hypothetical protein [Brevibacterium sp.]